MCAESFLEDKARRTEHALAEYLDSWKGVPASLDQAMRYSLFAGGKRLRPALALGAAEAIGGDDSVALPAACALEMIHTYSLIHDDLPCMDDDDLRRGKPTSHKVFGEAIAILAGDALLTMAFDLIAGTGNARVVRDIAQASGITGMAAGQVLDLESEGKPINLEALQHIHACKTGALIRASVRTGAILAGATPKQVSALSDYGEHLGLAFQITDDILDILGEEAALGKAIGSDTARGKTTYPSLVGVEASERLAREAAERACACLEPLGSKGDLFRVLARYVVERRS